MAIKISKTLVAYAVFKTIQMGFQIYFLWPYNDRENENYYYLNLALFILNFFVIFGNALSFNKRHKYIYCELGYSLLILIGCGFFTIHNYDIFSAKSSKQDDQGGSIPTNIGNNERNYCPNYFYMTVVNFVLQIFIVAFAMASFAVYKDASSPNETQPEENYGLSLENILNALPNRPLQERLPNRDAPSDLPPSYNTAVSMISERAAAETPPPPFDQLNSETLNESPPPLSPPPPYSESGNPSTSHNSPSGRQAYEMSSLNPSPLLQSPTNERSSLCLSAREGQVLSHRSIPSSQESQETENL